MAYGDVIYRSTLPRQDSHPDLLQSGSSTFEILETAFKKENVSLVMREQYVEKILETAFKKENVSLVMREQYVEKLGGDVTSNFGLLSTYVGLSLLRVVTSGAGTTSRRTPTSSRSPWLARPVVRSGSILSDAESIDLHHTNISAVFFLCLNEQKEKSPDVAKDEMLKAEYTKKAGEASSKSDKSKSEVSDKDDDNEGD
ncbi:hypothetical protein TRIUR3_29048 [Triticum urartu]|uniref:Uncharacterized protein n=1 Tax=Triticum urartu TaxID=4572 RepID=M8AZS4_TRIUA|nr:hypothetical protein TRIUR3_29048 [Triticum urartu]